MTQELRFDDKVVVITGAGAGLGRAHALMFGERGAKVVVNDLGGGTRGDGKSSAAADKVVAEIQAMGGTAVANYNSVEDGDQIIQTALDAFGTVDVVVNNAGILRDLSFQKLPVEDWNLIYRVHLYGTFRVTHAAWPIMRDKGYGRVIVTSSAAGIYGNFGQANYSAMKLGSLGLANTLAIEGKGKILVNTIAPLAASRLTENVLPPEIFDNLGPEYVSPLVGWLCHETCEENGGLFEVGAGTVNKLRWERTRGHAFRIKSVLQPEDFRARWSKICDFTQSEHPDSIGASAGAAFQNITNPKRGGNQFIDLDVAAEAPPLVLESSYSESDLSLYALGVGAGANPLDPAELALVHERGEPFYALPTFAVMPAASGFMQLMQEGRQPPGMNVPLDRVLHGEQYTEITRPLLPNAKLTHKFKLKEAFDKGKDAVAVVEVTSFDESGEQVMRNELTSFLRGCGGWGGERGVSAEVNVPPQRAPDAVIEEKTSPSQALLYRLSGDWNPLHVDPEFARNFGFEKPILHGLCTFGFVGRHVIKAFCNNDPRRFKSIKVRFAKSVYPGDTLVTRMWKESDQRIVFETSVKERNEVVIKGAAVELYAEIPAPKAKAQAAATAVAAAAAPAVKVLGADVFAAIGAYITAHPELVGQVKTLFQFKLSDPDSQWVIDLKAAPGAVRQGVADKPDATLTISDQNFLGMCTGADAQKLFFSGQLKISGNVMATSKLEFLKALDPKDFDLAMQQRVGSTASAAGPAPAAALAPSAEPTAADLFAAIAAHVAKDPGLVERTKTLFQFHLSDPDTKWVLDMKGAQCEVRQGSVEKPDATLITSEQNFVGMCTGTADAQKLFFAGKLKVTGNMMAANKLEFLKTMDPALLKQATAARLASGSTSAAPAEAVKTARPARSVEVMAALKQRLAANPQSAQRLAGKVAVLRVRDPDAVWTLDCRGATPALDAEPAKQADTVWTLSDEDLVVLAKGEQTPASLYQHGRMRVDGDTRLAHDLSLFSNLI
ncbi:MAG: SDR family NAD(P)-dependent oxidoreductase [Rhodoferax sp.]